MHLNGEAQAVGPVQPVPPHCSNWPAPGLGTLVLDVTADLVVVLLTGGWVVVLLTGSLVEVLLAGGGGLLPPEQVKSDGPGMT